MGNTIILPTINEADNVSRIIDSIRRKYPEARIVVTDDGSDDGTQEISSEKGAYVVDRSDKPSGLTGSVLDALAATTESCESENYVVMDADGQHPPEKIPELLEKLESFDIVISCRENSPGLSAFRKIVTYLSNLTANLGLWIRGKERFSDPLTGFFAFRGKVGKFMLKNREKFEESGLKILYDLLKLNPKFSVAEIKFDLARRISGESKAGFDHFIYLLRQITPDKGILGKISEQYLKPEFAKFSLIGVLGAVVNLSILWILTELAGLYYVLSAIIAIELTIVENFLLNDYWTFGRKAGRKFKHQFWKRCLGAHANRVTGLLLKIGTLVALVELAGIWYMLSMIIGISLAWLWNFFWADRFIFA